jgi:hypothetical protein
MERKLKLLFILFLLLTSVIRAQPVSVDTPKLLEKLYTRLINNYVDTNRLRINDSIMVIIENYVNSDTVFYHSFKNLKYLGQFTSSDSLLKIVTWNLVLSGSPGKYFCYIIKRQEIEKKNLIYKLTSDYKTPPLTTDTTYSEHNWYGALYYDIKPYTINGQKVWILLGIDYGNPFISRKVIEVLSFSSDNSIVFGRKWFSDGDVTRYRYVFEYASNGMMSLRFRSDSSIVFDHLVPFSPSVANDRQYYGPDYSYDAYILKNGLWWLMINVDARNKQ